MNLYQKTKFILKYLSLPIEYFSNPVSFNDKLNYLDVKRERKKLLSYPTYFGINLWNKCNQQCNFCHQNNARIIHQEYIDESTINEMKWLRFVHTIYLFAGNGESLLNPRFPQIVETVHKLAPHSQIGTFTNGLALNGENLDAIIKHLNTVHISLNAISRETYNHMIQNGNFNLVMRNLETLSERKPPTLTVELSMVYMKSTAHELKLMLEYAAKHGFETVTACHYILLVEDGQRLPIEESMSDSEEALENIREMEEYAKQLGVNLCFLQKLKTPDKCLNPWVSAYITVDVEGKPVFHSCCSGIHMDTYLNKSTYINFKKAWNGRRMQKIRETVNRQNKEELNNMCYFCRELDRSDKNWRYKLNKLAESRNGIRLVPYDLPHVFPKEVI